MSGRRKEGRKDGYIEGRREGREAGRKEGKERKGGRRKKEAMVSVRTISKGLLAEDKLERNTKRLG